MIKILPLLLAISVGDRKYDAQPEIQQKLVSRNKAACVMLTAWWVIDEVGGEESNIQCYEYSASAHQLEGEGNEFIHIIFFTFPFDERYWDNDDWDLPPESDVCDEFWIGSHTFNQCIDYRKFPELLPNVCK